MKKLLLIALVGMPLAYGLVWSEDPTLTEEQKEERRETNKRIAENMREMQKEKQRWIREQIEKGNAQEKEGGMGAPGTGSPSSMSDGSEQEDDESD